MLDGWWIEGYEGDNGFAIGELRPSCRMIEMDRLDAESMYRVLSEEVIPALLRTRCGRNSSSLDCHDETLDREPGAAIQQRSNGGRLC